MPRFDGTGPDGEGSMTGRALGNCNNKNNTDSNNTNKDRPRRLFRNRFFGFRGFGRPKRGQGRFRR
jgi:hypothetical protein